jgi:hypothetical protein
MKETKRFDSMWWGIIPGIILPLVALILIWTVKFDGGFFQFLTEFQHSGLLSKVISLATIPNLLLFFLFIWTDRTFSSRGVIFATLVLAFLMLMLKFA